MGRSFGPSRNLNAYMCSMPEASTHPIIRIGFPGTLWYMIAMASGMKQNPASQMMAKTVR